MKPSSAIAALAAAGACLGLGHWTGGGLFGWLGVAVMAWVLRASVPARALAAGLVAAGFARVYLGHPWHVGGLDDYLPGGPAVAWLVSVPYNALYVVPVAGAVMVTASAAWRLRWPVWAWLPVAWALGESAQDALTSLSHDAWLYGQWQAEPVLRAVGHLGWLPALVGGWMIAAAAAEAIASRSRAALAVAGLGLAALFALPPLPAGDPAAFEGIGAVHMADAQRPPRQAPPGLKLLVWPELAESQRPHLEEGPGHGAAVEAPFQQPGLWHLYGLKTQSALGPQNAMLALTPTGEVAGVRAKSRLFPFAERPWAGISVPGATAFRPGRAAPVLAAAGRRLGVLVCVEAVDRALAWRARAEGATMLAIASIDVVGGGTALARDQFLATAVMRAVETGLPVVRASQFGDAAMITPQGHLMARSTPGTDGVLTRAGDMAERAPAAMRLAAPADGLAVLYSRATPRLMPALRCTGWSAHAIEGFRNPGVRAATVIVSGDGMPPVYLGRPAAEVARAVASFHPSLVVVDTCFGAATPLLDALAAAGVRARVVAAPYRIPPAGLVFMPGFLEATSAEARALRVRTEPAFPLLRWAVAPGALKRVHAEVDALDAAALRRRLKRAVPPLVQAQLGDRPEPGARVLVLVPPARFRPRS